MFGSDGPGGDSAGPGGGSTASSTTASCPFKAPLPPWGGEFYFPSTVFLENMFGAFSQVRDARRKMEHEKLYNLALEPCLQLSMVSKINS